MTIQELYQKMDGDYEAAKKVMMMDQMIARFIVKLPNDPTYAALQAAGESMDPKALFETAHALKGVAANFGLTKMRDLASDITEEFRPGSERTMSDADVQEKLSAIRELYEKAMAGISEFTAG